MNKKILKLMMLLERDGKKKANFLKKYGGFHCFGENCHYHPNKVPSEPYLVAIHNNVNIAANVTLVTHDIICDMLNNKDINKKYGFYMGTIEIFDNVFIGTNTTIMYNTKIGPNAIIAAGSVVVKDVPEGYIVGGNPARVIGKVDDLAKKRLEISQTMPSDHDELEKINNFFWKKK